MLKNATKKQITALPGVEPGLSAGGELGDQQRPTLERNDMKLGPFN